MSVDLPLLSALSALSCDLHLQYSTNSPEGPPAPAPHLQLLFRKHTAHTHDSSHLLPLPHHLSTVYTTLPCTILLLPTPPVPYRATAPVNSAGVWSPAPQKQPNNQTPARCTTLTPSTTECVNMSIRPGQALFAYLAPTTKSISTFMPNHLPFPSSISYPQPVTYHTCPCAHHRFKTGFQLHCIPPCATTYCNPYSPNFSRPSCCATQITTEPLSR